MSGEPNSDLQPHQRDGTTLDEPQRLHRDIGSQLPHRSPFPGCHAGAGDTDAARARRDALHGIPLLEATREDGELARQLLELGAVPQSAPNDAAHVAIAVVNRVDYLVTWNFRHIANAAMRSSIEDVCRRAGHPLPVICSPNQLMEI